MYETISTVGERGQITLPKIIRDKEGLKSKDKVVVKIENNKIIVEKKLSKKEKEMLMKEYYIKYSGFHKKANEEWESADKPANRFLKWI